MSVSSIELPKNGLDESISFPTRDANTLAINDIKEGLSKWRIWFMLAYQDIKLRYRRSVLGPFWITLSMAITVYSMGYLYGHLFHTDLQTYFPFLVAGMLSWALISTSVTDLIDTFISHETMIKQIKMPYSLYVHRVAMRNIFIFFHNIVVIIPILAIFHKVAKVNIHTLLLFPGLFLIYFNAITYGLVLSMIGARYRDVSQIVKSLIQVVFFITPVMWQPEVLPANKLVIVWGNPFYAFVEIVRQPLLGMTPSFKSIVMVTAVTLVGCLIFFKMFARYRARIVYWV